LKEYWIPELQRNAKDDYQMMIVGNKSDLKSELSDDQIVPRNDGENIAKEYETLFVECSAKKNENVRNAFEELVERIIKKQTGLNQISAFHNSKKLNNYFSKDCC
jgi:GTPase SAR1 family protein